VDYEFEYRCVATYKVQPRDEYKVYRRLKQIHSRESEDSRYLSDSSNIVAAFLNCFNTFELVVQKWSELYSRCVDAVTLFMKVPTNRHKGVTPSLGELFWKYMFTTKIKMDDFFPIFIEEAFTRNILWALKDTPALSSKRVSKCYRITRSFWSNVTSLRIIGFYWAFFYMSEKGLSERPRDRNRLCESSYNTTRLENKEMEQDFRDIYSQLWEMQNFKQWYDIIHVSCPTGADLSKLLINCMDRSNKLHYHKHDNFFSPEKEIDDPISKLPQCICESTPCLWT
jgi:hypothetical protein